MDFALDADGLGPLKPKENPPGDVDEPLAAVAAPNLYGELSLSLLPGRGDSHAMHLETDA